MYLKRLEMLGFKSFAARTVLEFSPGITAVVGPNGSGKSNVADSMRWVLGEQNMRQLRGKKSDDIIFVGGQGKAALGMAEVSLTLDNSTGWVPSDYSEITVTRRTYRSGENEYLINKQKVRLKDVLLLLAQARIGHDSYTIIGQGLIDAALSQRAEERRGFFEDAAGIRPYQVQRTDAENRLKQTEQNLERLRDIVYEIEPRLAPLSEQARRAVEYTQLTNELQDVLVSWYALQWRRLCTIREQAEQAEHEQSTQVRSIEQALKHLEEQIQQMRSARQQTQAHFNEIRKNQQEASTFVQKLERDLAVNEERHAGLERQQRETQQEERRLRQRVIDLEKQSIDLEEQCDQADEAVDDHAARLATVESQVTSTQKEYELDQRRVRGAQNDLVQIQARLGATQSEVGRLQKQLGERNRTLATRRDTIAQAQQSLRNIETRLHDERVHLETARQEEQQLLQRKQIISRAMTEAQQEIERLKQLLNEAERRKRTVTDRIQMLKNWRQNLSGYSDGVRALLRAPAGKLTGVLGPVPQLGIVSEGMEMALETAFGQAMQAVVVTTLEDAKRALNYLESTHSGRAMIIWLERAEEDSDVTDIISIQDQAEEAVLLRFLEASPGLKERVKGFAWRLVRCEERYMLLFRRLLHGIVVVQELQDADDLLSWILQLSLSSVTDLPFTAVVTLQGEILHVNGWLTGGASNKNGAQQGLLAYERELRELPAQLDEHIVVIEKVNTLISEVQRGQEGRRIEQTALEKDLHKLTARINEMTKGISSLQREQDRLQTEIRLAVSIEQQLTAEVAGLEQEVQVGQERLKTHEKTQRELTGLVEELQEEMEERAIAFRRQQEEAGRMRTALAVKRQEAKALQQHLTTQRSQVREFKTQLEQLLARLKEAESQREILLATITQQHEAVTTARTQVKELIGQGQTIETQLSQHEQQITQCEQQRSLTQKKLNEQEIIYRRSLLESQRARDAVETLVTQLQEELSISDPQKLLQQASSDTATMVIEAEETATNEAAISLTDEEETQLRKYRRRIETLRNRIKVMGGCDINAPQIYEETKTRYEFLSTQIADMDQAAVHLRSIIAQLDATMARQFEATFQAINTRFREHFTTLFNGGTARLELIPAKGNEEEGVPVSSMPAGIDVIVQPPGKKVQDLSLLSGGERALVSAALLFSLLEINPPPFCLLDEVDAALDESNVTRFCDILKRLAQRTQFIVITHNRVTMSVAQVIYGVSMRESVSRMLSLRLEEVIMATDR